MSRFFYVVLAVLVCAAPVLLAAPLKPAAAPLVVEQARVHFTQDGDTSAPVMLVLRNTSPLPLRLVSATSPMAGRVRFMAFKDYGPLGKQPMEIDHIDLPPKAYMKLVPGNLEVRLDDLTQTLNPGLEIPLSLVLSDGTRVLTRVAITLDDPR